MCEGYVIDFQRFVPHKTELFAFSSVLLVVTPCVVQQKYDDYTRNVPTFVILQIPMEPCEVGARGETSGSTCADLASREDIAAGIGVRR
jgi:hypothetical protein